MKRTLAMLFSVGAAVGTVALSLGACDDSSYDSSGYGAGYGDSCQQQAACETCTPVYGCGWCETNDGKGACVSNPSECARATAFYFTWEPSGCRTAADAGVGGALPPGVDATGTPVDAGRPGEQDSAEPPDSAAAPDSGEAPDASAD
jgi:hypothetical protein